jgi:ERAP1-like protein
VFATLAVYGNDPELIQQACTNAVAFVKEGQSTNRSWALQSLAIAARNGDANLYQKYRERMKAARTPEEYYPYFFAIAFFHEPELVKTNFDFVLSPDVRNQDMAILGRMIANPETRSVAWELYQNDFKEIHAKLGESLGDGSLAFLTGFCDPQTRDQSQNFFKAQSIPGIERTLQNARDEADACIELRSLQGQNLAAYLKQ